MDFDEVLKHVGQFGRFQKYVLALIAIPCIISCWQAFLQAFLGYIPPHRCWIDGCDNDTTSYNEPWLNATIPFERHDGVWGPKACERFVWNSSIDTCPPSHLSGQEESCSKWKFDDSEFTSTIATKWQLFCSKEYLVALTGTVNLAGGFIGSVAMGTVADRYGRKFAILICLALLVVFGIGASVSPSVVFLMVLRFFIESVESSLYYISFVLVMEYTGPEKRVIVSQIIQLIYSVGEMMLAGLAYFIRDWSMLQLCTTLPAVFFLSFHWILPESARWLLAKGKVEEGNKIIKKMARWNKGILADEMGVQVQYGSLQSDNVSVKSDTTMINDTKDLILPEKPNNYTAIDLFRTPRLRARTLLLMLCWFMNVLVYTGITLGATSISISKSAILSFFFSGLVEIPANLLSIFTMDYLGRRITLCGSFFLTGAALISIQFIPDEPEYNWVFVLMTLLGKFGSTVGNAVLYLFSAEIFPTVLRNSGLGLCGFVTTIAASIAPQMQLFSRVTEALPYILFGAGSFIGGLASLTQPETLKKNLPQTIEDAENFGT